ncbi:uncharacterized protein F5147DRAFT_653170 [Suillus discolor]|uniref:Uncharacterized protein n=1 Tax=Suillus discolor TaxID=1912936 RepID=A0A9P7F6W5_9AGAM|nr:uncharacterized protein F5147DRAFT_653170 [Suillus discolor]KAG2107634.1 hypothetical protein F5147DRAFT_653170 [Suillus discolor]
MFNPPFNAKASNTRVTWSFLISCNYHKMATSITVTLEAQIFSEPQHASHQHRPGLPRVLPGNGPDEPTVLIITQKVASLETVQWQLNNVNLDLMIDLLEEIFASSIVDRVHKTVFDSSWKSYPALQCPDFETWYLGPDCSITSATTAPSPQSTQNPSCNTLKSLSSELSVETNVVMAMQEAPHDSTSHFDSEQEASVGTSLGAEQSGLPPLYNTVVNNQPVIFIQNGIIVRINQEDYISVPKI